MYWLIFALVFITTAWGAKSFSLMLSQSEQDALKDVQKKAKKSTHDTNQENKINGDFLYLSSIMFFDPERWTIWLNDGSIHKHDHLHWPIHIQSVQPNSVSIFLNSNPEHTLTLRPHQSMDLTTGKIYDGDKRTSPNFPSTPENDTNEHEQE
jgi:hypothetical protein